MISTWPHNITREIFLAIGHRIKILNISDKVILGDRDKNLEHHRDLKRCSQPEETDCKDISKEEIEPKKDSGLALSANLLVFK